MNSLKKASSGVQNMLKGAKHQLTHSRYNGVLHNRFVLYFIFIIAMGNLFYLTMLQDVVYVATFILVGFLTSFFSKNMMVILFIATAITNILKYGTQIRVNEGFESDKTDGDKTDGDKKDGDKKDGMTGKKDGMTGKKDGMTGKKDDDTKKEEMTDLGELNLETKKMLQGIEKMTPLLQKAETFIDHAMSKAQ
jgi:hypothetical protein